MRLWQPKLPSAMAWCNNPPFTHPTSATQNAIRFVSYEALKGLLGIKKAKTDT